MIIRLNHAPAGRLLLAGFSAATLFAAVAVSQEPDVVAAGSGNGGLFKSRDNTAPCPCPPQNLVPIVPQPGGPTAPGQPGQPGAEAPPNVQIGEQPTGATASSSFALAAPNMVGDLLGGNRNVNYALFTKNPFAGEAGTGIFNPKISENESPLPQDRVAFRYNFFHDASQITGVTGTTTAPPTDNRTRQFDTNLYTFQFEKTFLDGYASAGLRAPFTTGVSPRQTIRATTQDGFQPTTLANEGTIGRRAINGRFTPQDTQGSESTDFGDLTLIFKGILFARDHFTLTGGTTVGVPTAPDTHVSVIDSYFLTSRNQIVLGENRFRDFTLKNDNWSMGPFLGFVATPTDRFFAQGFAQVEFPLGSNQFRYFEDEGPKDPVNDVPLTVNGKSTPFAQDGHVRDQTLLNVDLGTGYWLVKDPCPDRWLNGLAGILELHYTTTLNDANIVTLPADNVTNTSGGIRRVPPNPLIGNQRNRLDIFDMTTGVSALVADRLMLTTAVAFPLSQGDNKVFNWELQIQVNYYFGGPRIRTPNF